LLRRSLISICWNNNVVLIALAMIIGFVAADDVEADYNVNFKPPLIFSDE